MCAVPHDINAKHVNWPAQMNFWRANPVQAAIDIFGNGRTDEDAFDLDKPQRAVLNSRWRHDYQIDIFTRGGGKCICPSSMVITDQGMLTLEELKPEGSVVGFPSPLDVGVHGLYGPCQATQWYDDGEQDGFHLVSEAGFEVKGTHAHRIICWEDGQYVEKKLEDVTAGDTLVILRGQRLFGNKTNVKNKLESHTIGCKPISVNLPSEITDDLAYFLGLLTGDGCCKYENWVSLHSEDSQLLDWFYAACYRLFGHCPTAGSENRCRSWKLHSVTIRRFLENLGLGYEGARDKAIPIAVRQAPKDIVKSFLQGLFDTDGGVESSRNRISYGSSSHKLIQQVQIALANFGVVARMRHKPAVNAWELTISSGDVDVFNKQIGFRLQRKIDRLQPSTTRNPNVDTIPCVQNLIRKMLNAVKERGLSTCQILGQRLQSQACSYARGEYQPSYKKVEEILDGLVCMRGNAHYDHLKHLCNIRPYFDKVKSKEPWRGRVADLVVPEGNLFCANGMVQHNTFMNAITAVLQAMLNPGQRVGLVAPSFRQSKLIFGEIERLHIISPLFQSSVAKGPSTTPEKCYIQFKASEGKVGSVIEALPMGSDGAKIRGARYYYVIADELAQIEPEILDVVVGGFMATSQNPMRRAKLVTRLDRELKEGKITPQDYKVALGGGNKFVGTSTAFYQYNHLWSRVSSIIEDVYEQKQLLIRKNQPNDHLVLKGGDLNNQLPARYLSDGRQAFCAFPWWDMAPGFMDIGNVERQRKIMSNYQFLMEYGCYFPPDSEGFFRRSLLDAARSHGLFSVALKPRDRYIYVMGIDPARASDNFAVSLFEVDLILSNMRLVRVWAWNRKPFPEMHRRIREIIAEYNVKLIKMDSGGGGREMRDLFADRGNCPAGMKLILEKDNPDHMSLQGDRIMAPLVEFSNYEWLQGANEGMKSALEHGKMLIASRYPAAGEIYNPSIIDKVEEVEEELEKTLMEISSIITKVTPNGNRMNWGTPSKSQRKDRYSATLIGFDAARTLIEQNGKSVALAMGFWI
jgi:intein/homing endonuclease